MIFRTAFMMLKLLQTNQEYSLCLIFKAQVVQ